MTTDNDWQLDLAIWTLKPQTPISSSEKWHKISKFRQQRYVFVRASSKKLLVKRLILLSLPEMVMLAYMWQPKPEILLSRELWQSWWKFRRQIWDLRSRTARRKCFQAIVSNDWQTKTAIWLQNRKYRWNYDGQDRNSNAKSAGFYRAMHFSAKRRIGIAYRPSVCLSVCP